MPKRSRKARPTRCGGFPCIAPMPRLTLGSRKYTGSNCAWVSVKCRMRALPKRSRSYTPALSAPRAMRGNPFESAAAPASVRKSRRRMVMRCFPRLPKRTRHTESSAYLEVFPAFFFACRLEDRSLGQRFGFLGLRHRLVEVALVGGLFGVGQRRGGHGPLIAQRGGFLVGGFRRGVGGLEIGFGTRGQSERGAGQEQRRRQRKED